MTKEILIIDDNLDIRQLVSGILIDQVERVIDTYSDWICLKVSEKIDDWVLLNGKL